MWAEFDIELDPAFVERDAARKAGHPVEIARTARTVIRETIFADVPKLYRIGTMPEMAGWIQPMQKSLEEELEFMQAYIAHAYPFYDYGLWTLLDRGTGRVIGRAGLMPSEILDDAVELGYMIAPEYQRQGLAVECGGAILEYASEVLDLTELHLLAERNNEASVRTAKRLGFEEKEILYQNHKELIHYIWRVDE